MLVRSSRTLIKLTTVSVLSLACIVFSMTAHAGLEATSFDNGSDAFINGCSDSKFETQSGTSIDGSVTAANDGTNINGSAIINLAAAVFFVATINNLNAGGGTWSSGIGSGSIIVSQFLLAQNGSLFINLLFSGSGACSSINFRIIATLLVTISLIDALSSGTSGTAFDVFFSSLTRAASLMTALINNRTSASGGFGFRSEAGTVPIAGGFLLDNGTTGSAGDGYDFPLGFWASYQHNDFSNDFAATAYDGDDDAVFIGMDTSPYDSVLVGIALGYGTTDTDTRFNRGAQEINAYSVIPYGGALVDIGLADLTLDAAMGYTHTSIDQFRRLPGATARITSSTSGHRGFISGNATVSQTYGSVLLAARLGMLVARDKVDGFTESDGTVVPRQVSDLGQFRLGVDGSYLLGSFEPFMSFTYEFDFNREDLRLAAGTQPANDDEGAVVGAGIRWFSDSGVTATAQWDTVAGREDFDSNTYSLQIRADW